MFKNIFKKKRKTNIKNNHDKVLISCLLIHAAKMDEKYTDMERKIIKKSLLKLFDISELEIDKIINEAEKTEEQTNQIIQFTKEIKKHSVKFRLKIIEILWEIIYSDRKADIYEANLMRRIVGLLYLSDKDVGEIKKKFITEKN